MKSMPVKSLVLVAAILAACAYVLQHRVRSWLAGEGRFTDGSELRVALDDELLRHAVWDAPRAWTDAARSAGAATTALTLEQSRVALSTDGRWLVFAAGARGLNVDLYALELGTSKEPVRIARVNSAADDLAPSFSEHFLYFASDRDGGGGRLDLWRAAYHAGEFAEAERLPERFQSSADDTDPAPSIDDDELLFASDRGGDFDLYRALAPGAPADPTPAVRLEALATSAAEREPALARDGRALFFASDRPRENGPAGFALYRATRIGDANGDFRELDWSGARALAELDGSTAQRAPALAAGGFELFFAREAAGSGAGATEGSQLWSSRSREVYALPREAWTWFDTAVVASLALMALIAALSRRWPALDLIWKCLLLSLLVHLLVLLWMRYVVLGGGGFEPRTETRHRVRLAPSDSSSRPLAERAGTLERARASSLPADVRAQRAALDDPNAERPSPDSARLAERSAEPRATAPERGRVESPEASAAPSIDVETPSVAVERHGERERPLELAATASGLPGASPPTSAARAELGGTDSNAPSSSTGRTQFDEQAEPDGRAPSRVADALAPPMEGARALDLAVRAPSDAPRPRGGGTAHPLELEPASERSSAAQAAQAAPRRASIAEAGVDAARATPGASAPTLRSPALADSSATDAPRRATDAQRIGGAAASGVDVARPADSASDAPDARARRSGAPAALELAPTSSASLGHSGPGELAARANGFGGLGAEGSSSGDARPSTSARLDSAGADSEAASVPGRSRISGAGGGAQPGGGSSAARVGVAGPSDAADAASGGRAQRSQGAPGLALDAGRAHVGAQGTGVDVAAERPSFASEGASAARGAEAPGPLRLARGTQDGEAFAAPSRSTQAEVPVPGASRVPLALDDRRPDDARRSSAGGDGGAPDLLDGFVASSGTPSSTSDANAGAARRDSVAALPDVEAPARPSRTNAPLARAPAAEREPDGVQRKPWAETPYENRSPAERAKALKLHGGDARTEEAVARGLAYLARVQKRGGSWGDPGALDDKYGSVAIGKTGLVLLAFLGTGHTHRSGSEYSDTVARAIDFLVAEQDEESGHFGDAEAYGHGIATYALAECLAMSGDPRLRQVVERGVARILAQQNTRSDARLAGGWSYFYKDGHVFDRWPRTAITAWQVMALESARLSGVSVPDAAFDAARGFLENARDEQAGLWLYNHDPERLRSEYATLPASTPAAMFALSLLGDDLASDGYRAFRSFVLERRPDGYRYVNDDAFVAHGTGNLYFWYYGTLSMFRAGGQSWERWNEGMKRTLVPAQNRDGSWEPIDPYARYARDRSDDKSYTTALCVLSLEVYYRYYLPLLKVR